MRAQAAAVTAPSVVLEAEMEERRGHSRDEGAQAGETGEVRRDSPSGGGDLAVPTSREGQGRRQERR